ncbi:MAG: DUF1844 domain-containing protein [Endomicrobium sp.]|jgi:hypothetical protein|nr:DUF1844 domain-containing protein [Endomicrobium sp.]
MSEEKAIDINPYFFNLISMFSSSAWCQLGKMQNPVTGKIEKDLKGAQTAIEMLLMVREKTKGNLNDREEKMLASTISNLQINYADEAAKPDLKAEHGNNSADNGNTEKV